MAARLRVLQPGNPECAREREEKKDEEIKEEEKEEERGEQRKERRREKKKQRREEPSSLFISLPGRSTFYLPPRAHTCTVCVYIYIGGRVCGRVRVHIGCSSQVSERISEMNVTRKKN